MKQEVRSAAEAERGVEEREGMDKSSRKVGEWRSYGNTAGFLGIMDLLEDSDRELRVRPENMPDVSSSPGHPQSRQSPGFTQSCGLGWQSKRGGREMSVYYMRQWLWLTLEFKLFKEERVWRVRDREGEKKTGSIGLLDLLESKIVERIGLW